MKKIAILFLLTFMYFTARSQKENLCNEEGIASFYSNYFEGRKTASGEIFTQYDYTAAHKSLPFGTWVKVINVQNKRSVIVCINDRGPFIKGRIIDLTKSAAKEIGKLESGIFKVRVQIYEKEKPVSLPRKLKKSIVACIQD